MARNYPPQEVDDSAMISPYEKESGTLRLAIERQVLGGISRALEAASWSVCRRVGYRLGSTLFASGRKRRELAISNVRAALGLGRTEAVQAARGSMQNWGMTTCEFLHMPRATASEIADYVSLEGLDHYRAALAGGKGAILLMAHFGNWEVLAARLAQEFSIAAIVRPLSSRTLQDHMTAIRRDKGITLISKYGAGRPALRLLQRGASLCILPDRHAGPEGTLLPFFHKPTLFETAPARIAVMSGAPIVPLFGVRRTPWLTDGRIAGRFMPQFEVGAATRADRERAVRQGSMDVIHAIEHMVRLHPEQWTWMLRRWRDSDATGGEPSRRALPARPPRSR